MRAGGARKLLAYGTNDKIKDIHEKSGQVRKAKVDTRLDPESLAGVEKLNFLT